MVAQVIFAAVGAAYGAMRGVQQKPLVPEPVTAAVTKPKVSTTGNVNIPFGSALPEGRINAIQLMNAARDYVARYPALEQVDPVVTAAMAMTESGGNTLNLNPFAKRYEPNFHRMYVPEKSADYATSYGVLQLMLQSADELWLRGFKDFPRPTAATLTRNADNLYYSMALQADYKRRNSLARANPEFLVRAYNGGLGWRSSDSGVEQTGKHYAKYVNNRAKLISAIA